MQICRREVILDRGTVAPNRHLATVVRRVLQDGDDSLRAGQWATRSEHVGNAQNARIRGGSEKLFGCQFSCGIPTKRAAWGLLGRRVVAGVSVDGGRGEKDQLWRTCASSRCGDECADKREVLLLLDPRVLLGNQRDCAPSQMQDGVEKAQFLWTCQQRGITKVSIRISREENSIMPRVT